MILELVAERLEDVAADALLVPVDGKLCRLGGAAAAALRAALSADERDDELEFVADQLARMQPLPHPEARSTASRAGSISSSPPPIRTTSTT